MDLSQTVESPVSAENEVTEQQLEQNETTADQVAVEDNLKSKPKTKARRFGTFFSNMKSRFLKKNASAEKKDADDKVEEDENKDDSCQTELQEPTEDKSIDDKKSKVDAESDIKPEEEEVVKAEAQPLNGGVISNETEALLAEKKSLAAEDHVESSVNPEAAEDEVTVKEFVLVDDSAVGGDNGLNEATQE